METKHTKYLKIEIQLSNNWSLLVVKVKNA